MQQGAQSLGTEPESHESLLNNNQDSENLKWDVTSDTKIPERFSFNTDLLKYML